MIAIASVSCGGGSDPGADPLADAVPEAEPPTATSVTASTTPATEAAPATRSVTHGLGVTEVPVEPERIVVMDPGTILPTLLALGVPVVAAPLPDEPFPTDLVPAEALADIASVGLPEVSFELVAAVEPDLIIGFDRSLGDDYAVLSEIAPTVGVELDLNDWRGTAERIAEAIGPTAEAAMDEALAAYDERVAALRAGLGDAIDTEVSIVRAIGQNIRLHTRFHFAGQVVDDVGFARPEAQRTDDPEVRNIQVSLEELDLADGDVLFVFGAGRLGSLGGAGVDATIQAVLDHPLFPRLRAAENEAVVVVDPLGWQQGGLPAANLILDDLEAAFS